MGSGVLHSEPSSFNRRILVVDSDGYRSLRFGSVDGVDQTRIRPGFPQELPMPYLRSAAVGLVIPEDLDRALVVGLGGGALPRFIEARFPQATIDAVDIDPVVARIAKDYFGLTESDRLHVHVMDAVDYVKQSRESYDYILLDAYDADDLPAALATRSFFLDVKSLLDGNDGVVVVNIAIRGVLRTDSMIRTLTEVFGYCVQMRSTPSLNDVLLLADKPLPSGEELRQRLGQISDSLDLRASIRSHINAAQPCAA